MHHRIMKCDFAENLYVHFLGPLFIINFIISLFLVQLVLDILGDFWTFNIGVFQWNPLGSYCKAVICSDKVREESTVEDVLAWPGA